MGHLTTHQRLQQARAEIWANNVLNTAEQMVDLNEKTGIKKEYKEAVSYALGIKLAFAIR